MANTLSKEQLRLGLDSRLVSYFDQGIADEALKNPPLALAAVLDRLVTSGLGKRQLTSLFRSKIHLLKNVDIREDSVLHLHWMSGVADLKWLVELGLNKRRIIWTLHDMAPFTGFCHQSEDCRGFETGCKECPFATRLVQGRIESQFKANFDLISNFPRLTVVAPSGWMASLAKSSLMFKGLPIQTIVNPISNEFFDVSLDANGARGNLGLGSGIFVVAQIANDLLDPNKQIVRCAELLAELGKRRDFNYRHLLIGANGKKLAERFPSTLYLGSLGSSDLASALMAADVLLSTSIAESAGLTILEAAALGKPSIVMDGTGSRDQIVPGLTGLIVNDWGDLKDQLLNIQSSSGKLGAFGKAAIQQAQKHRPEIVANRYVDTYQSDQFPFSSQNLG